MTQDPFMLAVITSPQFFPEEVTILEALLEAGLSRLHVRKPGGEDEKLLYLLHQLAPRWHSRLVLHGSRELAIACDIPQVHGPVRFASGMGMRDAGTSERGVSGAGASETGMSGGGGAMAVLGQGLAVSTSVHSWEEMWALPEGLAYAFLSPLFDSISKKGYQGNPALLQRPPGPCPCKAIGMGGIDGDTIGEVIRGGWDGAAVLGWIWKEPRQAVERLEVLQEAIKRYSI